jgi:hypothetical protein
MYPFIVILYGFPSGAIVGNSQITFVIHHDEQALHTGLQGAAFHLVPESFILAAFLVEAIYIFYRIELVPAFCDGSKIDRIQFSLLEGAMQGPLGQGYVQGFDRRA